MFKEDTKRFYRNLGMKNIESREPPSMAEAETYWKSLWGEEAQHNERAVISVLHCTHSIIKRAEQS